MALTDNTLQGHQERIALYESQIAQLKRDIDILRSQVLALGGTKWWTDGVY